MGKTQLPHTSRRRVSCGGELNRVNRIALPMIIVTVCQYTLRISPMFMLGHLNELSFSSASIATSLCNVTGFSVVFGMAGALETLCGQAYGANQFKKVGTYTQTAVICLLFTCLPIAVMFIFTEKILLLSGQDHEISSEAGKFGIWMIPTLIPYSILQALIRYLQAQGLVIPMVWSSVAALCFQLPLCWALIFKFNLGNGGAATAIALSHWFYCGVLIVYCKFSKKCSSTQADAPLTMKVFYSMMDFFKLSVPSAAMVCLEWWSFELILLLSGLLSNPKLETSIISISFTISYLHYHIPYSFGAAASTLISNNLGAGKPDAARVTLYSVLFLSVSEFVAASIITVSCGRVIGYAFSKEAEVVSYVQKMAPFLSLSITLDGLQAVLSGVARGTGWQHIGAYVNLAAYYGVGTPTAYGLGFVFHLKSVGLWCGLVAGSVTQCIALSVVAMLTDWEKQTMEARHRIFPGEVPRANDMEMQPALLLEETRD